MKAVFYPFGGRKTASSRYRVFGPCDHRPEFEVGRDGDGKWRQADAVVFQKRCDEWIRNTAGAARKAGKLVVLDYSDVYLSERAGLMGQLAFMSGKAHVLTCSNPGDMTVLHRITGRTVVVVPNAQDLSTYTVKKIHKEKARPVIIWNGHSSRRKTLDVVWPALKQLARDGVRFQVLLVSDRSAVAKGRHIDGKHPVWFQQWRLKNVNAVMLRGDVAINPQLRQHDGMWHKDRNKTVTAWACGLPCVDFTDCGLSVEKWRGRLRKLLTGWELRAKMGAEGIEKAKAWGVGPVSALWVGLTEKQLGKLRKRGKS